MTTPHDETSSANWEVLPPPPVVPLTEVDQYGTPANGSPDGRTLRLIPRVWVAWASSLGIPAVIMAITAVFASSGSAILAGLIPAALFLLMSGWVMYRSVCAPRLSVNAEGFTLKAYGLRPDEIAIPWTEVESLHLRIVGRRRGDALTMVVVTRTDGAFATRSHTRRSGLELPLGGADYATVDRVLQRYCPHGYS